LAQAIGPRPCGQNLRTFLLVAHRQVLMARSSRILGCLFVAAVVHSALQLVAFVGGPIRTTVQPSRTKPNKAVPLRARGGEEDYTVTDADIQKFYDETLTGSGGLPKHDSVIGALIIKHFLGTFDAEKGAFTRTAKYKGPPPGLPGKRDMGPAVESLKEQMKLGNFVGKAGKAWNTLEEEKIVDDGKGWIWLVADMTPGGLFLELYKTVPMGKRPLLIAKQAEVDTLFEKVNWDIMNSRFEVTMGGPHIKQR